MRGVILGAIASWLVHGHASRFLPERPAGALRFTGAVALLAAPVWAALSLSGVRFVIDPCFALFGVALGAAIERICASPKIENHSRALIFALLSAWCVSISVRYKTPALGAGALAATLIPLSLAGFRADGGPGRARLVTAVLLALAVISAAFFDAGRRGYVYRDLPARKLKFALDEVFPGAKMLKTGPGTLAFLHDLTGAIEKARGKPFCIVPDLAAYWVESPHRNPLPTDWAQGTELCNMRLLKRVIEDVERARGARVIIVQKFLAEAVSEKLIEVPDAPFYELVKYIRDKFKKTAETNFFEIYE